MFLTTKNKEKIAKKDIGVWKIFIMINGECRSFYREHLYEDEVEQPGVQLVPIKELYGSFVDYYKGYHSFKTKKQALFCLKQEAMNFSEITDIQPILEVRMCIIPKGATYVLGAFYGENDSYVSSTIKLCATS